MMITKLRAARLLPSLTACALLALSLSASAAEPEDQASHQVGQIVALYRVDLGGMHLGQFRVTTTLRGSTYELRGEARLSVLDGLLYEWKSSAASAGRVTSAGPQPSIYAVNLVAGGSQEKLRMVFSGQKVSEVSIVPGIKPNPRTVPVTAAHLEGVLDPMSATFLLARSDNPNGDPKVCRQTVPVFDGRQRFDLVLNPKRVTMVTRQTPDGYAGPAAVCRVKFIPISGHHPQNPGIKLMAETNEIEVWLVPLPRTDMYVPYRIVLPTLIGTGIAVATHFEVQGGSRRAQLAE